MRILLISPAFHSFYRALINRFISQGIKAELHICCLKRDIIADTTGLTVRILPENNSYNSAQNAKAIIQYIKEKRITHIFYPNMYEEVSLIKQICQAGISAKTFFLFHSMPNLIEVNKRYQLRNKKINEAQSIKEFVQLLLPNVYLLLLSIHIRRRFRSFYRYCDFIVFLSPQYIAEYKNLIKIKQVKEEKLLALTNPMHLPLSTIPIHEKKKQIIFVGRLSEEKAIEHLLNSWSLIHYKLNDWSLVIIGDGPKENKLRKIVVAERLERVAFLGYQDAIPYIDESAILCLTSIFEGLPTVFIEAMSLGVVPIGFDSFAAIYDIIDNGENGFIIPAFDTEKYASVLLTLAKNDKLRYKIAANAQQKIQQFSIVNVSKRWYDVLIRK